MHDRAGRAPSRLRSHGFFLAEFLPIVPAVSALVSATEMPIYRFAGCELDPAERRLIAHGRAVTLTPKVFDTLVLLVEHAGRVVSKDELMAALWPRGFVHESNLTKHIWLIRKALGDSEHDARCIETVSKLGYRFVAPVEASARADVPVRVAAAPVSAIDAAPVRAERVEPAVPPQASMRRRAYRIGLGAAALIAAIALAWRFAPREDTAIPPRTGTAVAIVDFNNLSQNAKDAWLGPALVEMLGAEIALGEHVFVLPDEIVRPARSGLSIPLAGGFAPQTLAALKKRVGADFVLSGSYLVSGAAETPTLRIDLALQDAVSGNAVASVSQSGPVADLSAVVTRTGAALRDAAGFRPASAEALQSVANAQPPNLDVARRVGFALDALHRNDPARARDELLDAIAEAPGYAPAYSYLAQAWSALGYRAKAAAAAEQAAAHAQGLPEEQRLQIEVQRQAAQNAWEKAADAARALVALKPENPDYRLRLIQLLVSAHKDADAAAALDALSKRPGAASDPRVELAAADVAGVRSDVKSAAVHAREALKLAQVRDAPGQIADAQLQLGAALSYIGETAEARRLLKLAIAGYQRIGHLRGEADAREALGKSLSSTNEGDAAREEYQRAMAIYQSIGDLGGTTIAYSDLSRMLWSAGDLDGAKTAAQHVLDLSRETGDLRMQTWGLQALATAASDEAASDEVLEDYRETIALDEKTGSDSGIVWHLSSYADVLRLRGDLAAAQAACNRASEVVKNVGDPQFRLVAFFTCAEIALDRGDVAGAERGLAETMTLAQATADPITMANVEITLAQIDMGRERWADARPRLERAAEGYAKAEGNTGTADAVALLAVCADELGDAKARDAAIARATELRRGITEHQEVFVVDVALAMLRARNGDKAAIGDLRALAKDAEARHWVGWSLESRLAAYEVLAARHDPAAAPLRAEISSAAREPGYGWVLTRLGDTPA
jgi:DNA-binding winged helix-turn-helix (wHTH) protein/tetratricopeptide (TPR) repeat protein